MNRRGMLVIISGPSGVGKGTILNEVFKRDSNLCYSISSTTRMPRIGEVDGVDYNFITKTEFLKNIEDGLMLEYAEYCDNYYGTSLSFVDEKLSLGMDVVLEIETLGAMQIKEKCPDAVMIFISPPSLGELKKRLLGRATESDDIINKRIEKAKLEMSNISSYDYIVVNNKVEDAVQDILTILQAERLKTIRNNFIGEVF